jgi:hypothetical protein
MFRLWKVARVAIGSHAQCLWLTYGSVDARFFCCCPLVPGQTWLPIGKRGPNGKNLRFALLRYDDNILELIQNPEARPLAKAVPGIKDPFEIHGIFKTGFTVHNLDDVFNQLKQGGVKIDFNITQLNDLGLRAFGVRDVDGNLIQFFGR